MKRKKITLMIAAVITTSIIMANFDGTTNKVFAATNITEENYLDDSRSISNKNSIYLSDINYDTKLSFTKWKSIMKDANTSGETIKLKVDGEVVSFSKGMGAHANSQMVYDISEYSDEYSRLSTYLGVDYGQLGKGNGVKFSIYTSQDYSNWNLIKETEVLTAADESLYLDLNIKGVKYVKLCASDNGSNANDHSVYGNLRLVKTDYDINSELYNGFNKLAYYDEILSENSLEENYNNNLNLVLQREFVNRIGYRTIQSAVNDSEDVKKALDWLLTDEDALQLFIEAGSLMNGSSLKTLNALGSLYANFKECLSDFEDGYVYKKMLIATAVAYCKDIKTFATTYGGYAVSSDPVKKFTEFKKLYDEDKFLRKDEFKTYNMELVRYVLDARMDDEEISWLRSYSQDKYPNDISKRLNGYSYMKYVNIGYGSADLYSEENKDIWEERYSLSKYGVTSYGEANRYRLWMIMEKGGICWGISNTGVNVNEVHGIPAVNIYQPGHEAYLLYSQDNNGNGIWSIWNNVSADNWASSYSRWGSNTNSEARLLLGWGCKPYNNFSNNGSYMLLSQGALNKYEDYKKSLFYNLIANSYPIGSEQREYIYNKALNILDINLDSYDGLIESYIESGNKSSKEWTSLAKKVIKAYTYYPRVMVDTINRISKQVTDPIDLAELDMLKTNALYRAKNATEKESLQADACKVIANSLLGNNSVDLATFSFSGEYKNSIKLHENYDGLNLMVRYSLDGGKTWNNSQDHIIQLTEQEVNSIKADTDIIVGLVGIDTTYTIDISTGKEIKASDIYANDLENRFIGNIDNLEYSLDEGDIWSDYTEDVRFTGDKIVKLRYKANGTSLTSKFIEAKFTENDIDLSRKYISIDSIKSIKYANEQNISSSGNNMVDGNDTTQWHTKWNMITEDKSYTVEFDEIKDLSAIEYLPSGQNGRISDIKVEVSLDSEKWDTIVDSQKLSNNTSLKKVDFKTVKARFVRITANGTYGNTTGEINKYVSGLAYRFYEDKSLMLNFKEPFITYMSDTNIITNKDVIATINITEGTEVEGNNSYTFSENGEYTFNYIRPDGTTGSVIAKVDNIDKELPIGTVEYSISEDKSAIIAKVKTNEEVEFIDGDSIELKESASHVFNFKDAAGNLNTAVASVNFITKDNEDVRFIDQNINAYMTRIPVMVLIKNQDLEIINGENIQKFSDNGSYVFHVRNKKTGEVRFIPVRVDSFK